LDREKFRWKIVLIPQQLEIHSYLEANTSPNSLKDTEMIEKKHRNQLDRNNSGLEHDGLLCKRNYEEQND
jgi:hypothetical protein